MSSQSVEANTSDREQAEVKRSVHVRSFSEGKQIRQGSGRHEVGRNTAEVENQETLEDDWNKGWDVSALGQEDKLATNRANTGTIYTHTQAPGESDQGRDRQSGRRTKPHKQGRGIWNNRRGKYTRQEQGQNYNMDRDITWTPFRDGTRHPRLVKVEIPNESGVHDIAGQDPASLFQTVSLPFHQVLVTMVPSTNRQKQLHREDRGWGSGGWDLWSAVLHQLDPGHMEFRVHPQGHGELEANGCRVNHLGERPTKRGANLHNLTLRGRSFQNNHTICPGL